VESGLVADDRDQFVRLFVLLCPLEVESEVHVHIERGMWIMKSELD
jgi:hypothetical protein